MTTNEKPLRIVLGDLTHTTAGRQSYMMPLGIGFIGSYALSRVGADNAEVRLFATPEEVLNAIDTWRPHVLGLANYCWNTAVAMRVLRYAKEQKPDMVCLGGGPEFPHLRDVHSYMAERPYLDFYAYKEGEDAFAELVEKISGGAGLAELKREPQTGMMAVNPDTGKLVIGAEAPRIMDMDTIPSPYLSGMMDPFFNEMYAPALETARGCPFTCTFCVQGDAWWRKIAKFSTDRIRDELTYMGKKMAQHPGIELGIYDSNFGMYKRDEEIGEHIRNLQNIYGWPDAINTATGKGNWDRIIQIANRVRHAFTVGCSVQSMDDTTLEAISRKNMPMPLYRKVVAEIKSRGGRALAETIVPLPEETKESFFEGLRKLSNAGIETFIPHTTMMLKGTELASPETRSKYEMVTRFRVLPKQFGDYRGEKCFEIEEVCISTNTMSFDEYLDCRGFAWVCAMLSDKQYDPLCLLAEEAGIDLYDWAYAVWRLITTEDTEITPVYDSFIQEMRDELFLSEGDIYDFFADDENYRKLVSGEFGGNLTRKYLAMVALEKFGPLLELAGRPLQAHFGASGCLMRDIQKWMLMTRDVGAAIRDERYFARVEFLELSFDVDTWHLQPNGARKPLTEFNRPVRYRIAVDGDRMETVLNSQRALHGRNINDLAASLMTNSRRSPDLWRTCKLVEIVETGS